MSIAQIVNFLCRLDTSVSTQNADVCYRLTLVPRSSSWETTAGLNLFAPLPRSFARSPGGMLAGIKKGHGVNMALVDYSRPEPACYPHGAMCETFQGKFRCYE